LLHQHSLVRAESGHRVISLELFALSGTELIASGTEDALSIYGCPAPLSHDTPKVLGKRASQLPVSQVQLSIVVEPVGNATSCRRGDIHVIFAIPLVCVALWMVNNDVWHPIVNVAVFFAVPVSVEHGKQAILS